MKNIPLLLGTIIGTLLLVIGIVFVLSRASTPTQVTVDPATAIGADPHIIGKPDAPITIVEFSDFQCPACKAIQPLIKQVLTQYPDKVRLVYRHFPLYSIHLYADLAARASEVAAEDGQFVAYHDLLFERQSEWSELNNEQEVTERLAMYAQELGIDKASFLERIDSDRIKSLVTDDVTAGGQFNIQATPTLYVDGQQTPASQLLTVVESSSNNK